jgi:hypothetical protein
MRLLATSYCTLDLDTTASIVIFRRREVSYPTVEVLEAEAKRVELALERFASEGFHLLVDLRAIVPRNDPVFEEAVVGLRRTLYRHARRVAIVVRTAVGALQVQRHARDDGVEARVMQDEREALVYLLNPEGDSALSGRPTPVSAIIPSPVSPRSTAVPIAGSPSRHPVSGRG